MPAPLCADAQADAKSFVEIPAIAEIDDAAGCTGVGTDANIAVNDV
ncbi:MAG TPA: hypothetical protein VIR54_03045 [Vicinamibacterales bacterium]